MHLWRFNGSFLCTKEKFRVVFAITVRDIFILVVYQREQLLKKCDSAMYGAFVIPAGSVRDFPETGHWYLNF